jgi:hypothetical protein
MVMIGGWLIIVLATLGHFSPAVFDDRVYFLWLSTSSQ